MADKKVRLIDANALMKRICGKECGQHFKECDIEGDDTRCVFRDYVQSEPTVEAEPDNGWISVKDRLPDDDVSILICSERKTISKATYSSDMGRYYIADSDLWYNELDITHWMPLPEPPKGE